MVIPYYLYCGMHLTILRVKISPICAFHFNLVPNLVLSDDGTGIDLGYRTISFLIYLKIKWKAEE
jgi:hypothetical protein